LGWREVPLLHLSPSYPPLHPAMSFKDMARAVGTTLPCPTKPSLMAVIGVVSTGAEVPRPSSQQNRLRAFDTFAQLGQQRTTCPTPKHCLLIRSLPFQRPSRALRTSPASSISQHVARRGRIDRPSAPLVRVSSRPLGMFMALDYEAEKSGRTYL
jgi:hypothetical protein